MSHAQRPTISGHLRIGELELSLESDSCGDVQTADISGADYGFTAMPRNTADLRKIALEMLAFVDAVDALDRG